MQHISQITRQLTAKLIKSSVLPETYYKRALEGSLGKSTGKGWHAWNGLCPFHDDRQAGTFYINKVTGAFWCFSCQTSGGDIIDFQMMKERVGFKDALYQLEGYAS